MTEHHEFVPAMRDFILAMAKHLPPSGARLRLLDVGGVTGAVMAEPRSDLDPIIVPADTTEWTAESGSIDAVVALNPTLTPKFLRTALDALRPGGRLIIVDTTGMLGESLVKKLESAGYTRILVEAALDSGAGVLMRGEKPHTTADTLERIQRVAARDDGLTDLSSYSGRYVHLLIRQTPNKPAWTLESGERVMWRAAALNSDGEPVLLAFSSLPKAVEFMQPAVIQGRIKDVNKVGKFSCETVRRWSRPVVLNPALTALDGRSVVFMAVDTESAEAPDE